MDLCLRHRHLRRQDVPICRIYDISRSSDDITAETVVEAINKYWAVRFGYPSTLTSDQDRQFGSQLFNNLMNIMGITKNRTNPYHQQSSGIVERWQSTLKTALRNMCSQVQGHGSRQVLLPTLLLGLRAILRTELAQTNLLTAVIYVYRLIFSGFRYPQHRTTIPTSTR